MFLVFDDDDDVLFYGIIALQECIKPYLYSGPLLGILFIGNLRMIQVLI